MERKIRCQDCGKKLIPETAIDGLCSTCYGIEINKLETINGHKKCTKCGQTLPKSSFTKNKRTRDGLSGWCRTCKRLGRIKRHYGRLFPNAEVIDKVKNKPIFKAYYSIPEAVQADIIQLALNGHTPTLYNINEQFIITVEVT